MGRTPCCDKGNVKKGPWSPEEDEKLKDYIHKHGTGCNWISLPQKAGLRRCGKSCRLRWLNYLRPDIKHGDFSEEEDRIICNLYTTIGTRWSVIAAQLPGRTDNDIKNYWNTKLKKKLMGINNNNILSTSTNSSSSSSSSPSSYSEHSNLFSNPNGPFSTTLLDPISFSSNLLNPTINSNLMISTTNSINNNNNATIPLLFHQVSQDQSFILPQKGSHDHVKAEHGLFGFGGDNQASCSSSDTEYGGGGVVEKRRSVSFVECRSSVDGWNDDQGMWMEATPLMDYGLEEIKQLISSSGCTNNVFFDEATH